MRWESPAVGSERCGWSHPWSSVPLGRTSTFHQDLWTGDGLAPGMGCSVAVHHLSGNIMMATVLCSIAQESPCQLKRKSMPTAGCFGDSISPAGLEAGQTAPTRSAMARYCPPQLRDIMLLGQVPNINTHSYDHWAWRPSAGNTDIATDHGDGGGRQCKKGSLGSLWGRSG